MTSKSEYLTLNKVQDKESDLGLVSRCNIHPSSITPFSTVYQSLKEVEYKVVFLSGQNAVTGECGSLTLTHYMSLPLPINFDKQKNEMFLHISKCASD